MSISSLVPTNYVLTSGPSSQMLWSNVLTLSTANCSTVNASSMVTNSIGANVVTLNSTLSVSTLTARTVNYSSIVGSSISSNTLTLSLVNTSTQNTQIYQVATTNPTTSYTAIQASHVSTGTTYNALVINPSGGNVGVGTTAPAAKLDVNGSFSVANNSVFGGGGQVYMSGNYLDSGGVSRPNLLLNVVDTFSRNSVTFSNGSLASIGTVYGSITHNGGGTSYNTSSDYRLKHNITPLSSSLQRIMLAKPCSFTYISDQHNKIHEGFIAHEIKEVVSGSVFGEKDSVNSDGSINSQQFDVSKLIPLAIGSIQELSTKLDATQQQLTAKSAALDALIAWAQTQGYPASS